MLCDRFRQGRMNGHREKPALKKLYARLTPDDTFISSRSLALPSRPYRKRSSSRSRWSRQLVLQSPGHLRRPGDWSSYSQAPVRLWPPEPSTDSLDLAHNRPALGVRLFQTGALTAHRCPDKLGMTGKRSRPTACCFPLARHSGPWLNRIRG